MVLAFDVANEEVVARYWPIVTNQDALDVNAAWAGEAGRLLKQALPTDTGNTFNISTPVGAACEATAHQDFPAWFVYSKALDSAGTIAVLAVRLGPIDSNSNDPLNISLSELVAANAGPNTTTSFTGSNVWNPSAPRVVVTDSDAWTPTIAVHDSEFVIFKPSS